MSSSHRRPLHPGSSRGDSIHYPSSHQGLLRSDSSRGDSPNHVPTEAGPSNHGTSTKPGTKIYSDYQYMIDNWPQRSPAGGPGKIGPHQYVGSHDKHPDVRISQDPLDWKVVKSMSKEERKRHFVARANLYSQTVPALIRVPNQLYIEDVLIDGGAKDRWIMTKPPCPIIVDKRHLVEAFPVIRMEENKNKLLLENGMNAEVIKSTMKWTRKHFEDSAVKKLLDMFLTQNLSRHKVPCKKIVAFGDYSMGVARFEMQAAGILSKLQIKYWPLQCQFKHAAVMSIHNTLETRVYNTKIPVFLRDRNYTEEDKKAATQFEKPMKIVDGDFGF